MRRAGHRRPSCRPENRAAGWAFLLTRQPARRSTLASMTFRAAALLTLVTCALAAAAALYGQGDARPGDPMLVPTVLNPLEDPRLAPYLALREASADRDLTRLQELAFDGDAFSSYLAALELRSEEHTS